MHVVSYERYTHKKEQKTCKYAKDKDEKKNMHENNVSWSRTYNLMKLHISMCCCCLCHVNFREYIRERTHSWDV